MEFDKIDYIIKLFAEEYKIDEKTASKIIYDLDLIDLLLDYFTYEIKEEEDRLSYEWEKEKKYNNDLYYGDIHGGI